MLTEERYQRILRRLQDKGIMKLQELCVLLEASESTVRREQIPEHWRKPIAEDTTIIER